MFQPQPTPFSIFYNPYQTYGVSADINGQVESDDSTNIDHGLGRRCDGSQPTQLRTASPYVHAQAQAACFTSYGHQRNQGCQAHQPTPFASPGAAAGAGARSSNSGGPSGRARVGDNPCPRPVEPVLGSASSGGSAGGLSGSGSPAPAAPQAAPAIARAAATGGGPSGLDHGGAPATAAPLSTVFPLHGAIPHSRLELDLESASSCSNNLFQHCPPASASNTSLQHPTRHLFALRHARRAASRSAPQMETDQSLQDDLAAQEAAARTWQPDIDGPRVGNKTPIDAITAEYAKADPVYRAKTMALPQTYSHYRPVKGDGNCGWRAIGFCYFELLIQQGSRELIEGESLRLSQLNDYLYNTGGYSPDMFMDFLDTTFQLFQDISEYIETPDAALALLERTFNDDASMGLLYHLRLLAASWLKGNRDQYAAWCENGVDAYCTSIIEPPEREIEELGVALLVEVLVKPVGFTLEIAYLDRSAGTEVNTHTFPEPNTSVGTFMHLLYRPGHYDILYKPGPSEIQVNRMSFAPATFASLPQYSSGYDFDPLAMIPGAGMVGPMSSLGHLGGASLDFPSSPQSPWFSSPHADASPTPPSQTMAGPSSYATSQQAPLLAQPAPPAPGMVGTASTHEIRFSRYQYDQMDSSPWQEPTFHTSTFKNSHFNRAHYNNPDFTPEEYRPGADEGEEPKAERSGRRKSQAKSRRHSSDDGGDFRVKKEK